MTDYERLCVGWLLRELGLKPIPMGRPRLLTPEKEREAREAVLAAPPRRRKAVLLDLSQRFGVSETTVRASVSRCA